MLTCRKARFKDRILTPYSAKNLLTGSAGFSYLDSK